MVITGVIKGDPVFFVKKYHEFSSQTYTTYSKLKVVYMALKNEWGQLFSLCMTSLLINKNTH